MICPPGSRLTNKILIMQTHDCPRHSQKLRHVDKLKALRQVQAHVIIDESVNFDDTAVAKIACHIWLNSILDAIDTMLWNSLQLHFIFISKSIYYREILIFEKKATTTRKKKWFLSDLTTTSMVMIINIAIMMMMKMNVVPNYHNSHSEPIFFVLPISYIYELLINKK